MTTAPRRSTTTRLLDGLSERGVKATFFLIGAQIENNGDVVRRMDEEGHQVGIHTFDHVKLTDLSRTDFDAQVETTRALLKSTLGHNDFLLRPPYGMLDESVKAWRAAPSSCGPSTRRTGGIRTPTGWCGRWWPGPGTAESS